MKVRGVGRAVVEGDGRGRGLNWVRWGRVPECLCLRPLCILSNKNTSLCQLLRLAPASCGVAWLSPISPSGVHALVWCKDCDDLV